MAGDNILKDYFVSHREELIRDVSALIAHDSRRTEPLEGMPFGKAGAECLAEAERIIASYGFPTCNDGNYALSAQFGPEPLRLDILAHLDIVPAGDGWTKTEPFKAKVEDGRLYGRGSADDKGPAWCALFAMRALKELGIPLKHGVRLVLGCAEETGGDDLDHYFESRAHAPMTFSPDAEFPLISIEKGGLFCMFRSAPKGSEALPRLLSAEGGIKSNVVPDRAEAVIEGLPLQSALSAAASMMERHKIRIECTEENGCVTARFFGATAHASTPERGENAVTAMLGYIAMLPLAPSELTERMKSLAVLFPHTDYNGHALGVDYEDELSGKTTLSLNVFSAAPGSINARFDCRASLAATDENTARVVYARLEEAGFAVNDPSRGLYRPHHVPEDSELVTKLLKAYSTVTGKDAKPIAIGGGTYVHGIENGVAFGCATADVDNHMHGADEFMLIDVMLESCEIFARAIIELCG